MPFCKNCGSPVEGPFCAKCGTPQAAAPPPAGAAYNPPPPAPPSGAAYAPPPPPPAQPYSQPGYAPPPPPPPPAQPYSQPAYGAPPQAAAGGLTENVAGLLCYIVGLITGILFLVIEPYNKSKFVRFHAFQSIFLNIAWIAVWIVLAIFGGIVRLALGYLTTAFLMSLVHLVVGLGFFILWIFLMMKAYQGQKFMLPIIGPLADKQA